jgi:N-acetylglucosamine-6-sulfatase
VGGRDCLAAVAAVVSLVAAALTAVASGPGTSPAPAATAPPPNFVFVLTDDLSLNLLRYMPQVKAMQREGTTFRRYFVTDSLCCPSRATIFSGRYPHSTGVFRNGGPDGGFEVFHRNAERDTFATSLQARQYDTAFMGKYLNGYTPRGVVDGAGSFVPPGWSVWVGAGGAYGEYDYNLLQKPYGDPRVVKPRVVHYGHKPEDYLTDVISNRGREFIRAAVQRQHPFMLELATFAPHGPFEPAPRDKDKFLNARVPRSRLFNRPQPKPRPLWLKDTPLTDSEVNELDGDFRNRARSVQAADKMIADVRAELSRLGVASNTYLVFSSDNGFHMGERRLLKGKQTAWDHDIRVPLVVIGPGVPPGRTIDAVTANTDLRPTFQELAGAPIDRAVEGRSLAPLLRGEMVRRWRRVTLVEHQGPNGNPKDPDGAKPREGDPPGYKALRFRNSLWVQYENPRYRSEYYNLKKDPLEHHNIAGKLSRKRRARLRVLLKRLSTCADGPSCQAADGG